MEGFDMSVITHFFTNYGWKLGVLALSGIVLLGFLKWVGVFKKVPDKAKKYVYVGVSTLFSIASCTIYLLVTKTFEWAGWGIMSGAVFSVTTIAYQIYEHTGLRTLWKTVVLNNIAKLFKAIVGAIVNGTLSTEKVKAEAIKLLSLIHI